MNNSVDNRRRFFRIVDALGVSYRIMTETEINRQKGGDTADDATEEGAEEPLFVDTFSVMKNYSQGIQEALDVIKPRDPETAKAIEQLNKKVDAMLMMLELDSLITQRACHRVEEASISASGIAFPIAEKLNENTVLALDLLLRPSAKNITAIGRVISCESLSDDPLYYLRVEFTEMTTPDKETLIQHIVQRQGALLRSLRDGEEM